MKKCTNCGCENIDQAVFCAGCGQKLGEAPQPDETEIFDETQELEEQPEKKPWNKKIIIVASIVIAAIVAVGATGLIRIQEFRSYVKEFQKECSSYPSLGQYEDDYTQELEDAQTIISGFKFWETGKQKKQMQELSQTVADMNQRVAKYQKTYQDDVARIETDGKYFAGDYEDEYKKSKESCEEALKDFDEESSKRETEDFTKLVDKIIKYNETEGADMASEVKNAGKAEHSCETYLLSQNAEKVKKSYADKNYKQEKEDYDTYKGWKEKFSTPETINNYEQVDVSGNKKIHLYVNGDNKDESWDKDSFLIYEKKNKSSEWTKCSVAEVQQIKGNMTIDLVADISTSMEDQFSDMQNCLSRFADETEEDTTLGLSIISSVYERKLEFTKDKSSVESAINNLTCEGSTCLYQSLYSSVLYTASATGSRCVVAFTDGKNEPYDSGYDYYEDDVINIATTYQIPIYLIGIGSDIEEGTLQSIANSTGGFYRNISSVSDLYDIYEQIYDRQKSVYQITYDSSLKNRENRAVYVYGESTDGNDIIRFQNNINAETLADAYASSDDISASDLASYYTKKKYISEYDLNAITNAEDIQTIINVYYAKNGYKFGNADVLAQMKSMGVISKNGSLSMNAAVSKIKKNSKLFSNLMALYNYRYELFYDMGYDVYYNEGYTDYSDFADEINSKIGENDTSRYKDLIKKVYKKMVHLYD